MLVAVLRTTISPIFSFGRWLKRWRTITAGRSRKRYVYILTMRLSVCRRLSRLSSVPACGDVVNSAQSDRYESLIKLLLFGLLAVLLAFVCVKLGRVVGSVDPGFVNFQLMKSVQLVRAACPVLGEVMCDLSGLGSSIVLIIFAVGSAVLSLSALVASTHKRLSQRPYLLLSAAILTLTIGLSRLMRGDYWTTDVHGGWAFGTAQAMGCWWLARCLIDPTVVVKSEACLQQGEVANGQTCGIGFKYFQTRKSLLQLQEALLFLVPGRGLEPPHLAAHGPEPCASTNSAIRAYTNHSIAF
jgi:hypothetical protein